ncbi:MAG TPA: restriction endonuclease subunit S [Longimicrobium sp.]|nr:restriction endonuclease subunit S [Longimicrobium sp.]
MSAWKMSRLDECCDVVSGATPSTSVADYWDGDICWATPKDLSELKGAYISDTPRKLTEAGLRSCAAMVLPAGSVLFSSRAPIGHVAVTARPMATNQGFKSFVPKPELVHAKFLYYWLRMNRPYLESLGNGATFKEVSKAVISQVEIPLPPLPEQWHIVEVLDRADALRTKRRAALAELDGLTRSLFLDMFGDPAGNPRGWPVRSLASLVRRGDKINYGVVQPGNDVENGVPLIRVSDLADGRVSHVALKRIAPAVEAAYKRSRLRGDEILVSCVGSIGVVAVADVSVSGFNIARAIARIPIADATDRIFISAYLNTDFVQRYFTNELRTVSQPTLNIKQLSETAVLFPSDDQRGEFARRVQAIDQLKAAQRASLAELDALFASLQHRAFRGEL